MQLWLALHENNSYFVQLCNVLREKAYAHEVSRWQQMKSSWKGPLSFSDQNVKHTRGL